MMKQLAIITISIILAFHFPVTSQNILPRGWASEIEDGKRWAQLFISFYRSQTAESSPRKESPKAEPDSNIPQSLVFRSAVVAEALQPADEEMLRVQIEESVVQCAQTIKSIQRQAERNRVRALDQLKQIGLSHRVLYERVKILRLRALPHPA